MTRLDYCSGDHVRVWIEVYKVRASGLVLDSPVLLLQGSEPGYTSIGFLRYSRFDLQDGVKPPYVLRIVNGLRGGKRRATGISVSINDVPLKAATALTNKTEFLEIPLSIPLVKDNNEMDVTVSGPPDATALVVIRSGARK